MLRLIRHYRTKGSLNKRTIETLNSGETKVRRLRTKNAELPNSLDDNPNLYVTIFTKYGWFAILPSVFSYKWTKEQIVEQLEARYPQIKEDNTKSKPSITELQLVVDEWSMTVDLKGVPKTKKATKAELEQARDDVLYRLQLRADTSRPRKPKGTVRKKTVSDGSLNYTHAWNYFYSTTYPQFSGTMPWKEAVGKVKEMWQDLRIEEKEEYREKYAQLLREGKDIFRGKVVTIEEKEKINSVVAKYKERYRQKEKDRQDKIQELGTLSND